MLFLNESSQICLSETLFFVSVLQSSDTWDGESDMGGFAGGGGGGGGSSGGGGTTTAGEGYTEAGLEEQGDAEVQGVSVASCFVSLLD